MKKHLTTLIINWQDRDIYEKNDMKKMVWECRPDTQEIHIQTKGHKRKFNLDSVCHELLHAIICEWEIDHKKLSEEQLVSRMSRAIVSILEQIAPWTDIIEVMKK
jgi:hypothetical protein